jgi:serine/threonine-protein kinase RsbW
MAPQPNRPAVKVSFPNKLGYERIAMESSASFARLLGFMGDRIEDLKTAVSEACLNAIEHGNQGRPEARVVVTMNFEDDTLSVIVRDEGTGMPETYWEPDVTKKVKKLEVFRGLGIFLINKLVDSVDFNHVTEKGHEVRMIMRRTH